MKRLMVLVAALAVARLAGAASGLQPNEYRGGWETYGQEGSHIFEFSIRGSKVRGIYCTHCADATTLAFLDGYLGTDGLRFEVRHVRDDGSTAYVDHATAVFRHGQLIVEGVSDNPDVGHFHYIMRKDPRGPAPLAGGPVGTLPPGPLVAPVHIPPGVRSPAHIPAGIWAHRICQYLQPRSCPYLPPGPPEQLTPAKVVGVWVGFRDGPGKQFFIIRRVGRQLRGMVCGPCDNPYTMAALGDFRIEGHTLKFNILHEDWGRPGFIPFHNQVTAQIADNEMRITFVANRGPVAHGKHRAAGGATLFGPISVDATKGNTP